MSHIHFQPSREFSLSGPLPSEPEIRLLLDAGVTRLSLAPSDCVVLSTEDHTHLDFLRLLRDCVSWGMQVDWRAMHDSRYPLQELSHLPPPTEDGATRSAWGEKYQFGKMYWRRGPGFITVKDTRASDRAARFVLDDSDSLHVFMTCQCPAEISDVAKSSERLQALSGMIEERLILRIAGRVLTLPVRACKWPIPYMSV